MRIVLIMAAEGWTDSFTLSCALDEHATRTPTLIVHARHPVVEREVAKHVAAVANASSVSVVDDDGVVDLGALLRQHGHDVTFLGFAASHPEYNKPGVVIFHGE